MSENFVPGQLYVSDNIVQSSSTNENFIGMDSDTIRITTQRTISSPTATGYAGEFCFGSELGITYLYFCTSTNTWVRIPLTWIL